MLRKMCRIAIQSGAEGGRQVRRGTDFRSVQNARDVSLTMHTVQTQELIPTSPPTVAMMQQILSQKSSPNKNKAVFK